MNTYEKSWGVPHPTCQRKADLPSIVMATPGRDAGRLRRQQGLSPRWLQAGNSFKVSTYEDAAGSRVK